MNVGRSLYLGTILSAAALTMSMVANATVNTVGQLECAPGETAIFNGDIWLCTDLLAQQQDAIDALMERVEALEANNADLQKQIDAEADARIAADEALQDAIDAEETARIAADDTLQAAIDAEEAARTAADDALQAAIDALDVTALEGRVGVLEGKTACVSDGSDQFDVFFDGCNVHVRNGVGTTDSIDGFGNLIVGYNEDGGVTKDRTGSHNLVIGQEHIYSSYGGLVAGYRNAVTGTNATVSGGILNEASGVHSSVSGGSSNDASGRNSNVSGGNGSNASGDNSSVSGGMSNEASGSASSVSGGNSNNASGLASSISGGGRNGAMGVSSNITGGEQCTVDVLFGWGVGDPDDHIAGCVITNLP